LFFICFICSVLALFTITPFTGTKKIIIARPANTLAPETYRIF
jgi:hypothetical protein